MQVRDNGVVFKKEQAASGGPYADRSAMAHTVLLDPSGGPSPCSIRPSPRALNPGTTSLRPITSRSGPRSKLLPFVGEAQADDVAQSFFLKMYERDILENRPAITGRFRNWLYVAARRHAIDEWRKSHRRPERARCRRRPRAGRPPGAEDAPATPTSPTP